MAATELATAYLSLVPSMRGAQGAIARELASVDADGIGRDLGGKMGGGLVGTFKSLVGPAIAALAAVGFGDLVREAAAASDATDKFKSTMNFAGLDTSAIDAATKAAKNYADQTVYDLPTIQATMAQLAANGVKDYTSITTAAGNLNAVAGGNAETFKSVSRAVTQSAGAGKLMTEDWNMLADAIPGASGQLQSAMKEAGAFEGNFKKAMENGEITAEEFQAAITKLGNTPIAEEAARSVTTFEGALGNLSATVNSGLMGALDALKPMITGAINGVASGLQAGFDWIGNAFSGLRDILLKGDFTGALREAFGLEEDSPAVGFMLKTHDVLTSGIPAIRDILLKGDFTGAFTKAFGVEEDSPIVDKLFTIRTKVSAAMDGIKGIFSGFTVPPMDQGVGAFFAGLIQSGAGVRDKLITAVAGAIPGVVESIAAAAPAILTAAVQSFTSLVTAVTSVIPSLLTALLGMLPSIIPVILGMVPVLLDAGLQLFQGLVQAVVVALPQIVSAVIGMLPQISAALLGALPMMVQAALGLFMGIVQAVVQILPLLIDSVMTLLPSIIGVLLGMLPALISAAVTLFLGLVMGILQALPSIITQLLAVLPSLIATLLGMLPAIIQAAVQLFTGLVNALPIILPALLGAVLRVGPQLVGTVLGMVPMLLGAGVGLLGALVSGAASMVGSLLGVFAGLGGRVLGALGNFGGLLVSVGRDMIQGLINGISGMMGAIGRAVISIVPEAIRGPFEQLLGIHSPSTVFRDYGHNIGQGLVLGLADMYGAVASATEGLAYVPGAPEFASSYALNTYGDYARPGDTDAAGVNLTQNVYPSEKMSEENLASIAARKITGALV